MRSKKSKTDFSLRPPFMADETIEVFDEYVFSAKSTFLIGTQLRIKRAHGRFKFVRHVVSVNREAEWIDVKDKFGKIRSFYTNDIKGPIPQRRKRKAVLNG